MTDLSKTIARLQKLHNQYTAEVADLAGKSESLAARLAEAQERVLQTADALAALTGKPTLTKLITDALAAPTSRQKMEAEVEAVEWPGALDVIAKPEIPLNGNLPPAEPGFQWAKNEVGEDVLIPLAPPAPLSVPGVVQTDIHLPPVEDDSAFESPETFLQ